LVIPQRSVREPYRPEGEPPTLFQYQNRHSATRFGREPYEGDLGTGTSGSVLRRATVPSS